MIRKMHIPHSKVMMILTAKMILVVLLMVVGFHWSSNQQQLEPTMALAANSTSDVGNILRPNNIAAVVKDTAPAVVKIDTEIQASVSGDEQLQDPFFRQFFGGNGRTQTQVQKATGSGCIVSEDGYILTNSHVIENASKIQVTLASNEICTAQVVGADHDLDLAVLKINPKEKLPTLKLGNSDNINVGDWVIAIGNPYGLDHTVTVGVISAKGRPVDVDDRHFSNLLQTDASINPGNSGGPLLNIQGEVVGINSAINAQAQGIGFSIPASTVLSVYQQLVNGDKVAHPYLGVSLQGESSSNGVVVVVGTVPNSPAEKAGIKAGDIIRAYNGAVMSQPQQLVDDVYRSKVGETVKLMVVRDGQDREVEVIIGDKNTILNN